MPACFVRPLSKRAVLCDMEQEGFFSLNDVFHIGLELSYLKSAALSTVFFRVNKEIRFEGSAVVFAQAV